MYSAFVETVGVWGVEGVEGTEGAEGTDELGGAEGVEGLDGAEGVEGAEFSVSGSFSVSFEGGDCSTLLSDDVGGAETLPSSGASQANAGNRNAHANSSAAKDFAFFIKIPHNIDKAKSAPNVNQEVHTKVKREQNSLVDILPEKTSAVNTH